MAATTSEATTRRKPSATGTDIRQCRAGGEDGRVGSIKITSRKFLVSPRSAEESDRAPARVAAKRIVVGAPPCAKPVHAPRAAADDRLPCPPRDPRVR